MAKNWDKNPETIDLINRVMYLAIYRVIRKHENVLDLVQDSWVKILIQEKNLLDVQKIVPWAKRVAINTAINWTKINKQKNIKETSTENINVFDKDCKRLITSSVLAEVINSEMNSSIDAAISKLQEHYKVVVELKLFYSINEEEIASKLSIPKGTVKSRYYKGRQLLRDLLRELE